jgi:hypothetical protein
MYLALWLGQHRLVIQVYLSKRLPDVGPVGALMVGRLSDKLVIKWRAKRGGKWYPEDRLRAAIPSTLVITPLSVLFSGLFVAYVPGKLGLALNLVCLFLNGIGASLLP